MQIRLLGHVEASVDDRPVALGGVKQRAVLAMLGLEANRLVTADRLIEGLWGEQPPPSAAKMVQNYVWRLRKALGDDGGTEIVTHGRGVRAADRPRADRRAAASSGWSRARRAPRGGAATPRARRSRCSAASRSPTSPRSRSPGAEIRRLEELRVTAARAGDRRRPGRGRHQEVVGEIERAAGREPPARAPARAAAAGALPLRAPGRGARGLPAGARDAGRADRRRAWPRAAAPARRDPAPGPGAGRSSRRRPSCREELDAPRRRR